MDVKTKDHAFASGGLLWKIFDRPDFEAKSLRYQVILVVLIVLVCWLPIAILSFITFGWNQFYLLFLRDVATHVRFLFVLPLLIFSRRTVNTAFNKTVSFFYETKIVDSTNQQEFEDVIDKIQRWKNSKIVDYVLIALVYFSFYVQERNHINNAVTYAPWHMVDDRITPAGWWYLALSLPVLQLLLYRWLYTVFLWIIFLRKLSKVNLHLSALHPDGVAGLGFLRYTQLSFFQVALAFSALTAGITNNLIIFSGISIVDYKIAFGAIFGFVFLLFIFPLFLLLPMLAKVRRKYFMEYSAQAWPISRKFEEELKAFCKTGEERPDTSWHVDLQGSFEKTAETNIILVDKSILLLFAAAVVLPFLPVLAQQVPLREVFLYIIQKVI